MITWVIYDIKDDKARREIAKCCKQAGLYRVQYSVFLGTLSPNEKDTLTLRCEEWLDEAVDSIYVFPMSKEELRQTVLLGQAFDKKLVTDEVKQLFL